MKSLCRLSPSSPTGASKQAVFPLPAGMTAGFVNLIDARDLSVSCEFLEIQP